MVDTGTVNPALLSMADRSFTQSVGTAAKSGVPSQVRANQGTILASNLDWLTPTPTSTPLPEMRKLLENHGYLLLKNLLPRADVLRMREHYFSQFTHTGLLKPKSDPVDGLYNTAHDVGIHKGLGAGNPTEEKELRVLTDAHQTDEYMQFLDHPKLRGTIRDLMGWEKEVLLKRTLLRHNVPGGSSTGLHYDRLFLRRGDAFFLTARAIGDIAHNGGGLYYLKDSAGLGEAIEPDFHIRAKEAGFTEGEQISAFNRHMSVGAYLADNNKDFATMQESVASKTGRQSKDFTWLIADFGAGDVVFHNPMVIHGSLGNDDEQGRIRLSTDLRFYERKDFDDGRADNRWTEFWKVDDRL